MMIDFLNGWINLQITRRHVILHDCFCHLKHIGQAQTAFFLGEAPGTLSGPNRPRKYAERVKNRNTCKQEVAMLTLVVQDLYYPYILCTLETYRKGDVAIGHGIPL